MDSTRSRYSFVAPCKMESFQPFDHRMSVRQDEILDLRYRSPKNSLEPQFPPTGRDVDSGDIAQTTTLKSFRLSDEEAVCRYLQDRLLLLQQQAGKRIAKLWIKGICPKKQARYPYRSKQRKDSQDTDPLLPEWWPIDLCKFTEPDHVDKDCKFPRRSRSCVLLTIASAYESLFAYLAPSAIAATAEEMERRSPGPKQDSGNAWMDCVPAGAHTVYNA
jgi:hypothetical protein